MWKLYNHTPVRNVRKGRKNLLPFVQGLRQLKIAASADATDAEEHGHEECCILPFTEVRRFGIPEPPPPNNPRHAVRRSARLAA